MRKFWVFFKLHFSARLAYRMDMLIYSFSSAFFPLIGLAIWMTASNFGNLPYDQSEILIYFMLAVYIGIATEMWQSWYISDDINNGNFSSLLLKPQSIFSRYITENLSDKVYKMSMVTLIFLAFYWVIPKGILSNVFISLESILLFIVALILGYLIVFIIELSVGLSAVWFYDVGFIKGYLDIANTFFGGKFIPLAFLPVFLSSLAIFLPFRYALAFPIELLLNKLDSNQIILGFIIEVTWLGIVIVVYKIVKSLFNKSYKGYGS